MQHIESAERIVAISAQLNAHLPTHTREKLVAEQRSLWDSEHRGRPFEAIEADVWRFRRFP